MSIETPIGGTGAMSGTGQSGSSGGETGVKQAAQQATEQTKAVAGEAKQHVTQLLGQTRSEVRQQVDQRSQQLTSSLQGLAGQLRSLRNGRPDQAGSLQHYLVDAEQRVSEWAQRLEQGGPDMLLRDVRSFARRKPGAFLLAAIGAGFVAGRVARVGVAAAHDQKEHDQKGHDQYGQQLASMQYGSPGMQSGLGLSSNAMPAGTMAGAAASPIDPTLPASGSEAFA